MTNEAKFSYQFSRSLSPSILVLVMIAYLGSAWVEAHLAGLSFNTLYLRIFVTAWVLLFLLKNYWPNKFEEHGYILWITTIGIMLPFCFGTILLFNAALTQENGAINYFATTEYVLSLFFLVQVLFHIRLILLIWIVGTTLATSTVLLIDNPNLESISEHCVYILPFFLTVLLVGGIINRSLFNFQRDKEQAVWNVANAIAHQLRTPLASIRNFSTGSKSHMPNLVNGYQIAANTQLLENPISSRKLEILENALDSITDEVQHSSALIDILIANSKPFVYRETPNNRIQISDIIEQAVESYPYNNPLERNLITVDLSRDFLINGLHNMVLHVMFNLIANAVEFAQKRKGGRITIQLEQEKRWNKVTIKDTGIGISRKHIYLVFDPFFSHNSHNGTGIGLSFCKSVMEGLGGKIECESKEGEFCLFILSFPKTDN